MTEQFEPYHFKGLYVNRGADKIVLLLPALNLKKGTTVWMDGVEYTVSNVKKDGTELKRVDK